MGPTRWLLASLALAGALPAMAAEAGQPWRSLYDGVRWSPYTKTWLGDGTSSRLTAEGLVISDPTPAPGSGRFYMVEWQADPVAGAALETRMRAISCSSAWGMAMGVADGLHEESLTIFPDRLLLVNAQQFVPFDAAGDFHTYRLEAKGEDLRLFVDDQLLVDGAGKFTTPAVDRRNQCGFGAGSSTATGEGIWQWVRYRSGLVEPAGPPTTPVPGLTVALGRTVDITPDAIYSSLFRFRDGRLAAGGKVSTDNGRTWRAGSGPGVGGYEFPDGEIINPGFETKKVAEGVFEVPMGRSTDGGKTFGDEKARLSIPEATGGTGDDGKHYEGPPVDHAIVQLRDGSLLMAMYGYFKTDTVLCPAFPPEWKLYKYRTWVMRSTDRGRSWNYRATVAYDPNVGCESFCEADLLRLPGGDILCFMRTGGSPPKYVTPLYLSRSSDDGRTWSKPVPIADRGVWPNACRMRSGVLAVTYGRPDNWLAFSLDDGRTWVGHTRLYEGPTTSYNSVEEVSPGKLLVVYDRPGPELGADGNQSRGVVGTFVTVRRR